MNLPREASHDRSPRELDRRARLRMCIEYFGMHRLFLDFQIFLHIFRFSAIIIVEKKDLFTIVLFVC